MTTTPVQATTPGQAPTTSSDAGSSSSCSKAYGRIVLTLDNVLISRDKITPSPSSLDGLDAESEMDLRIMGCELIQTSGILLKLPQTAMATGQVLFQRFYYSKSFVRQPMETTAMACIYLASKIEEAPRRIRDVINVFHHIKQVRSRKIIQPLILDPAYIRLKSDVTLAERRVLKELGFCVHVKHPHKLIVIYLQQLGYDKHSKFVQLSWNYMNDALRSNVFVRFTPESIACSCIFLTARVLKIPLPVSPAWYLLFDVTEADMMEICTSILVLYERPKVNIESLEKKVETLSKEYQESRNKSKPESSPGGTTIIVQSSNPNSRPSSPTATRSSSNTTEAGSHVSRPKESAEAVRRRAPEDNYVESWSHSGSGRKSRRDQSPIAKKPRKSPSPITYNDSPPRHKHKKRKKSRYSSSEASRSRSRSRHRRDRKKAHRHDRSRSPYSPRKHHHSSSSASSSSKKPHHYSSRH